SARHRGRGGSALLGHHHHRLRYAGDRGQPGHPELRADCGGGRNHLSFCRAVRTARRPLAAAAADGRPAGGVMDLRPHPAQIHGASKFFTIWIPVLSAIYLAVMKALGGPNPEHFLLVAILLALSFWSDGSRHIAKVRMPYLL